MTFVTQPVFNPVAADSLAVAGTDTSVSLDITGLVQGWNDDANANHGLALTMVSARVDFGTQEGGLGATLDLAVNPDGIAISSVIVSPTQLSIQGENFDNGDEPLVTLGDFGPLAVAPSTGDMILADLPLPQPDPGDYLLTVTTGPNPGQSITYDLTLGAQGPQGEPGEDGADGSDGSDGAQGIQGKLGPPGVPGNDGAAGANCYDGLSDQNNDNVIDVLDCIGPPGDAGEAGTGCTVAECPAEGVTTLSCGDTSVQVPCIFSCPTSLAFTQVGVDIDGEAAGDRSGYSVAMSSDGTTVVIGAPANDGAGNNAGHARVYAVGCAP